MTDEESKFAMNIFPVCSHTNIVVGVDAHGDPFHCATNIFIRVFAPNKYNKKKEVGTKGPTSFYIRFDYQTRG